MKLEVVLLLSVVAGEAFTVFLNCCSKGPRNVECSWNDRCMHAQLSTHTHDT